MLYSSLAVPARLKNVADFQIRPLLPRKNGSLPPPKSHRGLDRIHPSLPGAYKLFLHIFLLDNLNNDNTFSLEHNLYWRLEALTLDTRDWKLEAGNQKLDLDA